MSNLLKTDQRHFILKECVREKKNSKKKLDRTTQEVIQLKSVTDYAPTSHKYCFFSKWLWLKSTSKCFIPFKLCSPPCKKGVCHYFMGI